MSDTPPSLAFIGTGKMGGAILEGVAQAGADAPLIRATTQTEAAAELLRARGVDARSIEADSQANSWAVAGADMVILAVKPHYILEVASSIAPALETDAVVVSVAAGLTTAQIEAVVDQAVVRAMPNTPSQIQQGVTGIASGSRASADQMATVSDVFRSVGQVVVVDESQINHLSALSGSGPAYLFYIAEKLIDVAIEHGFSQDQATTMVQGTLMGAAALLDSSGETPQALRQAVTSPGGTTEQAIAVLDEHQMGQIWSEAIARAVARAEQMARDA